jgi:hypothetical protein
MGKSNRTHWKHTHNAKGPYWTNQTNITRAKAHWPVGKFKENTEETHTNTQYRKRQILTEHTNHQQWRGKINQDTPKQAPSLSLVFSNQHAVKAVHNSKAYGQLTWTFREGQTHDATGCQPPSTMEGAVVTLRPSPLDFQPMARNGPHTTPDSDHSNFEPHFCRYLWSVFKWSP